MEDGGLISQMKSGTELLPIQDLCRLCMNSATDDCFEIYENGEEVFELKHICEVLLQAKVDFSDTCLNKICLQCVADLKVCERMMEQLKNATYYLKLIERHSLYIKSEPPDESSFDGSQREDTNLRIPREAYVMTLETFLTDYDDAEQYLKDISQSEEVIFPPEHQPEDGENTLQMEGDSDEARVKLEPSEDLSEVEIVDVDSEENSVDFVELPSRKRKKSCRKAGPSSKQMAEKQKQIRRRKLYTDKSMRLAVLAVHNGVSVRKASRLFRVPRMTLSDKISGKTPEECTVGRKPVLAREEEERLVEWFVFCKGMGFPITEEQLVNSVKELVTRLKIENPFTNNTPGKSWVHSFVRRHPEISLQESALIKSRIFITVDDLRDWFGKVKTYLRRNNLFKILEEPNRVFNLDESAFFLCPKSGKVFARRWDGSVYIAGSNERENHTVLLNISADGTVAPGFILYQYQRIPAKITAKFPEDWGLGTSTNGWMTSNTFYEYMANVFDPYLTKQQVQRPVIVFLDGRVCRITHHLSELCSEKEIVLVPLYPNSTHILQPLDVGCFQPLEAAWKRELSDWRKLTGKLKREDFAPTFYSVAQRTLTKETIIKGFHTCGLLTLNPSDCDMTGLIKRH